MGHPFHLADVFTDRAFGGNPLAVFPDAHRIDERLMPLIARELNLSETVFVLPPEDPAHHSRLRIFTPRMELPFAGHPTIGAACTLLQIGRVRADGGRADIVFEEGVGPVPVEVRLAGGRTRAALTAASLPESGPPPPPRDALGELLGLDTGDILRSPLAPRAVSCGVPFLFVSVVNRAALARVRLNLSVWERLLAGFWAPHLYVLTRDAELPGSSVRARMFAPAMGIVEDPATGAAAAALAGYLVDAEPQGRGTLRWRIEQGFEMGRPSLIDVEADRSDAGLAAVRIAGRSVVIGEGRLELG